MGSHGVFSSLLLAVLGIMFPTAQVWAAKINSDGHKTVAKHHSETVQALANMAFGAISLFAQTAVPKAAKWAEGHAGIPSQVTETLLNTLATGAADGSAPTTSVTSVTTVTPAATAAPVSQAPSQS